mmetsp:Transcript_51235/g.153926  ORF Transcript_51235/g.153926 Transcript_51235/m.153926 type:complete len:218 (+) Transcript_51235:365-1018(+)
MMIESTNSSARRQMIVLAAVTRMSEGDSATVGTGLETARTSKTGSLKDTRGAGLAGTWRWLTCWDSPSSICSTILRTNRTRKIRGTNTTRYVRLLPLKRIGRVMTPGLLTLGPKRSLLPHQGEDITTVRLAFDVAAPKATQKVQASTGIAADIHSCLCCQGAAPRWQPRDWTKARIDTKTRRRDGLTPSITRTRTELSPWRIMKKAQSFDATRSSHS